jgi:hypothetical protein
LRQIVVAKDGQEKVIYINKPQSDHTSQRNPCDEYPRPLRGFEYGRIQYYSQPKQHSQQPQLVVVAWWLLKPNNNDSSGFGRRERVRKQYDFDDNDCDGFADNDGDGFDQDKLMVILSKKIGNRL